MIDQDTEIDLDLDNDQKPESEQGAAAPSVGGPDVEFPPAMDQRSGPVARFDDRHSVLWIGSMPIPFRVGESRNGELLDLLSVAIRQLRGLEEGEPCPLRRSEFELLAGLLDLDDPELRLDLRRCLGINRRQAGDTVMALRRLVSDNEIRLD